MNLSRFTFFVLKKFIQDDCSYRASALAFSTLLTMIPLMYTVLFLLSFSDLTKPLTAPIQTFVMNNFIPTTSLLIQSHLSQISQQIGQLPSGDIIFLVMTVFLTMFTIEQALNVIWEAPKSRHNFRAVLLYGAIIGFTPILLGLSLTASSFFFSLPFLHNSPLIVAFLIKQTPFIFSLFGFTFLYVLVPNCSVRLAEGLIGGLFSAVTFELAKKGFAIYLTQFHGYSRLYGAFAVIPVFFMWVYLVWMITLLGAEISFAYGKLVERRKDLT